MAMRMVTPLAEIDAYIDAELERIEMLTIRAFCFLGEKCIIEARDRSGEESWFDDSGNLRSSIGYVVVIDGEIVSTSSFGVVKQGGEGAKEGKDLAIELAKTYNKGYALIVVAGMNYAARVEALDNKVVLASAELFARRELPNMMKNLKKQLLR